MKINLKRLVLRKEVASIIKGLLDTPIVIQDSEGQVILGDASENLPKRYPIQIEEELIGWVLGEEKVSAVASLIALLATSELEKKALGRETLEKYREINFFYDITEKLASSLDLKQVAQLVIDEAKKLIKADNVSVMIINEETEMLEVIAATEESAFRLALKVGKGIAGSICKTGKAEIVNDVLSDPRYVDGTTKVSSLICAPLKIRDKEIGAINLSSKESAYYTAQDLKLLSELTLQAAFAIENARLYDSLKEAFLTAVQTLAETIEKRDPYTGGHTKRVMNYSLVIGKVLELSAEDMEKLKLAAVLHDIGKIGVRDNVLLKNGKLTDEEFEEIKKHTIYGQEVLQHIKHFKDVIPGVKYHHERYDGKGYPEGLRGEEVDVIARIIAVADTYDAMTSDRPYRKGLSKEIALAELKRCEGTQFDPLIVAAFLKAWGKKEEVIISEADI
jgi:HD-GYP domain-containing protein (c-di-GMP phosphodiesterase class II)